MTMIKKKQDEKLFVVFRSAGPIMITAAVFAVLFAGCASAPAENDWIEIPLMDRETTAAHDVAEADDGESEADLLWLQSEYERAVRLFERGEIRAAMVLITAVRSEAVKAGIEPPEGFEESYREIMDAAPGAETAAERDDRAALEELLLGRESEFDGPAVVAPEDEGRTQPPPDISYEQPLFRLPALLDPELADEEIILDFNQVDIRIVLETISDITGANFLVDRGVSGAVTLISSSEVKLSAVFRVLESILDVHGWAAVPTDDVIKVLPRGEGVRRHIPTRIGVDPAGIPRDDSFATQVMRLEHIKIAEAVPLIEPRMSPQGKLVAHEPSNTAFVTDISSNLYQIALILRQVDMPREREELVIFPLRFASARAMSEKINMLVESVAEESPRWQKELKIIPDLRTNSLIAFAERDLVAKVERLVASLDVPRPEESVNVHVLKLFNADAAEMVESLSPTIAALTDYEGADPVHITADIQTNALIIAASPQDFQVLRTVIEDLDVVREQVLVELRIMEATQFALKEVGFDWSTMDLPSEDSVRGLAGTFLGPRREFWVDPATGLLLGDGAVAALVKGDRIGAVMRALERHRNVNVLSTPHLLTSNHQEASIAVVENIPYVRETRIVVEEDRDVIRTFDYRDVGIILNITPHIGAGGMVRMVIGSEFSKVVEQEEGHLRTSKREANTTVSIESGETVVIGGLIQDDLVKTVRQVPLLGSIPLLGRLFRSESEDVEKTNLLIFITPHVLTTRHDLAEMTRRKEAETEEAE